jgi:3-oxoadipate enol-lactonase
VKRFVDVPGGRLWVADDGAGPPIVLLHAGIADQRAWDPMIPGLVAAGYRAVRYDGRGSGRSETEDVAFSNRDDVLAVMDALGIQRAALLGNSAGGQIAIDAAIERPDRVVAVIGVGAGVGGFEGDLTDEEQALIDEMERLEEAVPLDVDALVDLDLRLWVAGTRRSLDAVDPGVISLVGEMDRLANTPGRERGRPIPLRPRAADQLDRLRCPVLAIAGDLDISDVAQTARHLERHAPDARAMVVPGVAHLVGLEIPDRLVEIVVDFLRPLTRWD